MPKYRTFGAQEFERDVASKTGCEGYPAVGYRNVEAMVIGGRSYQGISIKR
jgi:hypothetical protein